MNDVCRCSVLDASDRIVGGIATPTALKTSLHTTPACRSVGQFRIALFQGSQRTAQYNQN